MHPNFQFYFGQDTVAAGKRPLFTPLNTQCNSVQFHNNILLSQEQLKNLAACRMKWTTQNKGKASMECNFATVMFAGDPK